MFDGLKGLGELGNLMRNLQQMKGQMQQMQEEMARKQITSDAGGGMVQATVNGKLELVKLKIDKSKINVNDTEMLEDVIIAAVHGAQAKAQEAMQEEMRKKAQEMGLPPGVL